MGYISNFLNEVYDFISKINYKGDEISVTVTVIIGIVTGVLTLIGLISIFISINSQHNLQKSREILWDLASISNRKFVKGDTKLGDEIHDKVLIYQKTISNKSDFTLKIIKNAKLTIIFSIIVFSITTYILKDTIANSALYLFVVLCTIMVAFLMIRFVMVLGKLNKITEIGEIPSIERLLDGDSLDSGVNTLSLAAKSCQLRILQWEEEYAVVAIGFPIPYKNIHIKPEIRVVMGGIGGPYQTPFEVEKDQIMNDNDFHLLNDDYYWYMICNKVDPDYNPVNLKPEQIRIDIIVNLISNQGTSEISFEDVKIKLRHGTEICTIPYMYGYSVFPSNIWNKYNTTNKLLSSRKLFKIIHGSVVQKEEYEGVFDYYEHH